MSLSPQVLDALLAAGATADMIVAAVKAELAVQAEADALRRQKATEKKRRQRAMSPVVPGTDGDEAGREGTAPDKEVSPTPPSRNYPPKGGNITARVREDGTDFDLFWAAYPRKIGKDDARKKFAAAIRSGATIGQLVAGVNRDRQRQWLDRPPDMIPHPATWLHQGRWKDEPEQHQPQAQGQPHERRHPPTDKFERHQANLERAVAGSQLAARLRAIEPESSF